MSLLQLRRGWLIHRAVQAIVAIFLVFGGSFLPYTPSYVVEPKAPKLVLQGEKAASFLARWEAKDQKAARAMAAAHLRGGPESARRSIVVISSPRSAAPTGLVGRLFEAFVGHAEEYSNESGILVLTPYDSDSGIAAFGMYYQDYGSGSYGGGDVSVNTYDVAYGDPDAAIDVSNAYQVCSSGSKATNTFASLLGWFGGPAFAQSSNGGVACDDWGAMTQQMHDSLKDSIKWGLAAAGGALIPCIGATVGYLACVGGAAIGAMAAVIGTDAATQAWNCRCTWFNVGCDNGDPDPM